LLGKGGLLSVVLVLVLVLASPSGEG